MLAFFTLVGPCITDTQGCESHKYRTIFTLAVGKWLRVGLVAGLAAFDDATNSDRKV